MSTADNSNEDDLMTSACRSVQRRVLSLRTCALDALSSLRSCISLPSQPTHAHHQVPLVFRESHIHGGYRAHGRPLWYYLSSLLSLHNETVNVWSHLVACILFILRALQTRDQVNYGQDPLAWALVGFAFGTFAYALCSTLAHLFQSKSKLWHYTCFQVDYIGIGLNGYGNTCLLYYLTGTEAYYRMFSSIFLTVNTICAVMVCVCFSVAKLRYRRPYPFQRKLWQLISCSIHVLFGIIPLLYKIYESLYVPYDGSSVHSIFRHLEYSFWFLVSTFFFASGIPERFAPGKFDIVGHGHQLFHIIMTYTSLLQYQTAVLDVQSRPKYLVNMASPDPWSILGGMVLVVFLDVLFIVCTHKHRVAKVLDDAKHEKPH